MILHGNAVSPADTTATSPLDSFLTSAVTAYDQSVTSNTLLMPLLAIAALLYLASAK